MIVGICGKSGSGKSTLSKSIINKYEDNAIHIEFDKIGHRVLDHSEVKLKLVQTFGKDVLNENKVSRKKLGNIVFNNCDKMNLLTNITWKYMQLEIDKIINNNQDKIIILDWLLLPKTKYLHICDLKILIDIPYEVRLKRALKRDGINKYDFDARERATIEYNYQDFDYIICSQNKSKVKKMVNII